jgi:hypothetical protein
MKTPSVECYALHTKFLTGFAFRSTNWIFAKIFSGPVADIAQCSLVCVEIDSLGSLGLNNPTPGLWPFAVVHERSVRCSLINLHHAGHNRLSNTYKHQDPKNDAKIFDQATDIHRRFRRVWRSVPWLDAGGLDRPLCD